MVVPLPEACQAVLERLGNARADVRALLDLDSLEAAFPFPEQPTPSGEDGRPEEQCSRQANDLKYSTH